MISLDNEEVLGLAAACKIIPATDGRRPHPSTVWRWCKKGLSGVRLEHIRVGRRVCTSREALNRFFNSLAEVDDWDQSATNKVRARRAASSKRRLDSIARAEQALDDEGCGSPTRGVDS